MKLGLAIWAVLATCIAGYFNQQLNERHEMVNKLIGAIGKWEAGHKACLGNTIDSLVWLGGCTYEGNASITTCERSATVLGKTPSGLMIWCTDPQDAVVSTHGPIVSSAEQPLDRPVVFFSGADR